MSDQTGKHEQQKGITALTTKQFITALKGNTVKTYGKELNFLKGAEGDRKVVIIQDVRVAERLVIDETQAFKYDVQISSGEFIQEFIIDGAIFKGGFRISDGIFFGDFTVKNASFFKHFIINGGQFKKRICLIRSSLKMVSIAGSATPILSETGLV